MKIFKFKSRGEAFISFIVAAIVFFALAFGIIEIATFAYKDVVINQHLEAIVKKAESKSALFIDKKPSDLIEYKNSSLRCNEKGEIVCSKYEKDDEGKRRPWIDVVKERCLLPAETKLRIDPRGFSYGEFRALIHLAPLPKISTLSSDTLRLMRDKVFLMLSEDTDWHIKRWTKIQKQIEEVAAYKGIKLIKFEK